MAQMPSNEEEVKAEGTSSSAVGLSLTLPSARKISLSFYALSALYAIPYGALSTLVPGFFIYGAHQGASDESIEQSNTVVQLQGVLIGVLWIVFLFFVPFLLPSLGGPRNSFVVMMFAWSIGGGMLVGAYILSLRGANSGVIAFGIIFAILIGTFGGLGYTAAEVYLDYCAEWMASVSTQGLHVVGSKNDDNVAEEEGSEPRPMTEGDAYVAKREVEHKILASKFKNRFASHLYAIIECGSIIFLLPIIFRGESAVQSLLIAVAACLAFGAIASVFLPNWQQPPKVGDHDHKRGSTSDEEGKDNLTSFHNAFVVARQSIIDCFICLSAYNWLSALAIVPYFFTGGFADVYRYNILLGPECGYREVPEGIGLSGVDLSLLISTIAQAVAAFAAPLTVGTNKFQLKEHVYPMAFGNFCGCLSCIVVIASGGNDAICGSFGLLTAANVLAAIGFAINNSVGVAAVLCWYEGNLQHWAVAALTSRSVWTNLGNFIVAPYVYSQAFGSLSNGIPCAIFTLVIYATGSICVVMAHWLNLRQVRIAEAQAHGLTPDEFRAESNRKSMTTGF